jgi:flagellin
MALTILNNISSKTAENALSSTQTSLQKTLTQLSTGLKINSGSDDAAGLSIAEGMTANIAALTQSEQNASNGVGMLQTADGALSEVTTLLNRAVTLATEGSTSGITSTQSAALNTEYTSIMSEIDQIGKTTDFNGQNVFANNTVSSYSSTQASLTMGTVGTPASAGTGTALTGGSVTSFTTGGGNFSYTAKTGDTVQNLVNAINSAAAAGTISTGVTASIAGGKLQIGSTAAAVTALTTNDEALGTFAADTDANYMDSSLTVSGGTAAVAAVAATGTALTSGSKTTITDSTTGGTFNFTAASGDTIATLAAAVTSAVKAGTLSAGTSATVADGKLTIASGGAGISVTTNDSVLGAMNAASSASTTSTVYIGDGTSNVVADTTISTTINALSSSQLGLASSDLTNSSDASAALTKITAAITSISAQRGVIGASVNRLTAASAVMSNQVTNLQSAANSIQNADIGVTVANMTQYNVLQSTGMAALQQSNQAQQAVLKLVQ